MFSVELLFSEIFFETFWPSYSLNSLAAGLRDIRTWISA